VHVLVDGHIPELAGLLLLEAEMLTGLQPTHLANGDPEEIARPEVGVYSGYLLRKKRE